MLALISAPSNLGLRPPQPGSVPGTAKAPEALREAGLHARLAAAGAATAEAVLRTVAASDLDGYWLHLDVDILDPEGMPAVDSPDPGGLQPAELTELLAALSPGAAGAQVTVFDPDLDPDGRYAVLLTEILAAGLRDTGQALVR